MIDWGQLRNLEATGACGNELRYPLTNQEHSYLKEKLGRLRKEKKH